MPSNPRTTARLRIVAARILGGPLAPAIRGWVLFTGVPGGSLVTVTVSGLPAYQPGTQFRPPIGPHGFHIHQFGTCQVGNPADPFQAAGGHWNPDNQPHGNHAGDFPVLFSNNGVARMSFFTDRFTPDEVIGRSVIIHLHPDDYRTQPDGNADPRVACGVIRQYDSTSVPSDIRRQHRSAISRFNRTRKT